MNSYISVNEQGRYEIDATAKDVFPSDIYAHYVKGVNNLNIALNNSKGPLVSNGPGFSTNAFSNSYWWGIAITYNDAETKNMVYALQQTATVGALIAAVSAFVPVLWLGSVTTAIESAGALMISNSMAYHNKGKGVTLNLHWLPAPYFESTPNY